MFKRIIGKKIKKQEEIKVKTFDLPAGYLKIIPKHDTIERYKEFCYVPYKDEITVAFDNTKIIYKLGDGIHEWVDLEAVSLEEALDKGYIYHNGGVNNIHKIKINITPNRIRLL